MIDPRRGGRRGVPRGAADRVLGVVVGRLGIPVAGVWMLEVRGRRSGLTRSVPVIPITVDGRQHLVAPRGTTQWVRNLDAAGEARLVRGRRRAPYTARRLTTDEAVPVLVAYTRATRRFTGRFFDLPADPDVEDVRLIAKRHPVFRLTPA